MVDKRARQREDALRRAQEVREARKAAKAKLKRREVKLADLLDDPDMQGQKVADLLRYLPVNGASRAKNPQGLAKKTATRLSNKIGVTTWTTVGELGDRRKALLLSVVRDKYGL